LVETRTKPGNWPPGRAVPRASNRTARNHLGPGGARKERRTKAVMTNSAGAHQAGRARPTFRLKGWDAAFSNGRERKRRPLLPGGRRGPSSSGLVVFAGLETWAQQARWPAAFTRLVEAAGPWASLLAGTPQPPSSSLGRPGRSRDPATEVGRMAGQAPWSSSRVGRGLRRELFAHGQIGPAAGGIFFVRKPRTSSVELGRRPAVDPAT